MTNDYDYESKLGRNRKSYTQRISVDSEEMFDKDEDFGEYSDVEKLVQNPAREKQEREQSYRQNSHPSSIQDVPSMSFLDDAEKQPESDTAEENWKFKASQYFYAIIKPFIFVLFMIFWILKEPVIRTITFLTIVVSTVIVDPILFLWSTISNRRPASVEKKKVLTQWFTAILVILGLYTLLQKYPVLNPGMPIYTPSRLTSYSDSDISNIYKRLNKIELKLKEQAADLSKLKTVSRDHWSSFKDHKQSEDEMFNAIQAQTLQFSEIKKALDSQQQQLNAHQVRLNEEIKRLLSDQLPNTILVSTDQSGNHLELSPQFYEFLKSPVFMDEFIKTNKASIEDYLSGRTKAYFEKHEREGALISKETFMKLISNDLLQHNGNNDLSESSVSLEDLIDLKVNQYHQDVLNTADFALASRGGRIIHSKTSPTYENNTPWYGQFRKAVGLKSLNHPADMITLPQTHVGECWRMKGTHGHVGILLSEPIYIQSVTIEHPSTQVLVGGSDSAPKLVEFYGIKDIKTDELLLLGRVEYNAFDKNSNVQTFSLNPHPTQVFEAVSVHIKSNWGNPAFTDVYRIRIHGVPSHKTL